MIQWRSLQVLGTTAALLATMAVVRAQEEQPVVPAPDAAPGAASPSLEGAVTPAPAPIEAVPPEAAPPAEAPAVPAPEAPAVPAPDAAAPPTDRAEPATPDAASPPAESAPVTPPVPAAPPERVPGTETPPMEDPAVRTPAEPAQPVEGAYIPYSERIARIRDLLAQMPDLQEIKPENRAYERGLTAYNQGNYTEAEAAFREAAQLRPDLSGYQYAVGTALFGMQRYADAETAFRTALAQDQDVAAYHYGLACALLSQHRYPDAQTAFREARRLNPSMVPESMLGGE